MRLIDYPPIQFPPEFNFPLLSDNRNWPARPARKRAEWMGSILSERASLLLDLLNVNDYGTSDEIIGAAGGALSELLLRNPDNLLWYPRGDDGVVDVRGHKVVVEHAGDPNLTELGDTLAVDMGLLLSREFLRLGRGLKWTIQKKGGKRGADYNASGVDGFPGLYPFFAPESMSRVLAYQVLKKGVAQATGWLEYFRHRRDKED